MFFFLVLPPEQKYLINYMRWSPDKEYNHLAEMTNAMTYFKDPDKSKTYRVVENQVIRDGVFAYATTNSDIIDNLSYLEEKYKTHWYRGTDTVMSEYPYFNWLSKKKWPLNEELNLHMMQYQEVTLRDLYLPT